MSSYSMTIWGESMCETSREVYWACSSVGDAGAKEIAVFLAVEKVWTGVHTFGLDRSLSWIQSQCG